MSCEDLCRSHNNASGQCRDSTSLPNKASSCELSDGSKNTESLKVLVLTVLRPSYLYPYYIALR
ncbi:uncharacterized protein K441DRAFT_665582 [Cenococcum geophilum 1.58]|uniref:uncharacterized protein n=1 Tax=Cenococcum geophilum 1.58 TaxID=794803 RepID=UPI00358F96E9|nr:hypothetical protein K441DRAFT_665582 [Cenococcum geophilum 1.58]